MATWKTAQRWYKEGKRPYLENEEADEINRSYLVKFNNWKESMWMLLDKTDGEMVVFTISPDEYNAKDWKHEFQ